MTLAPLIVRAAYVVKCKCSCTKISSDVCISNKLKEHVGIELGCQIGIEIVKFFPRHLDMRLQLPPNSLRTPR